MWAPTSRRCARMGFTDEDLDAHPIAARAGPRGEVAAGDRAVDRRRPGRGPDRARRRMARRPMSGSTDDVRKNRVALGGRQRRLSGAERVSARPMGPARLGRLGHPRGRPARAGRRRRSGRARVRVRCLPVRDQGGEARRAGHRARPHRRAAASRPDEDGGDRGAVPRGAGRRRADPVPRRELRPGLLRPRRDGVRGSVPHRPGGGARPASGWHVRVQRDDAVDLGRLGPR